MDPRDREGTRGALKGQSDNKGASPLRTVKINITILKSTQKWTGNQCNNARTGVNCSCSHVAYQSRVELQHFGAVVGGKVRIDPDTVCYSNQGV